MISSPPFFLINHNPLPKRPTRQHLVFLNDQAAERGFDVVSEFAFRFAMAFGYDFKKTVIGVPAAVPHNCECFRHSIGH
jgi:hypothetical protein